MTPTGSRGLLRSRPRRSSLLAVAACGVAAVLIAGITLGPGNPGPPPASDPTGAATPADTLSAEGGGAYRLRVRGLSPLIQEASSGAARIEIGARMDARGQGGIVIEAQLVDEATGRTLWEAAYRGADGSPEAVRRLVGEALRDAMTLTREGAGGPGRGI